MKQGEIWLVNIPDSVGHEFFKDRPCLIVQADKQIKKSKVCSVMPLTSNVSNRSADDIMIKSDKNSNLYCDSVLKVYHLTSFDHSRSVKRIGAVNNNILRKVKDYIKKHFNLD